jgi:hypothetical protein
MKQEIVEKAFMTVDVVYISELLAQPWNAFAAGHILKRAQNVFGDRSWIMAGLGAIESGHPEQAAAIAIADFFSTLEALEPEKPKSERGQGLLEFSTIAFFLGVAILACYLILMPVMTKAIQSVPAPVSAVAIVQPLDDNTIMQIATNDAALCSTSPSNHAAIAHGSAAWQAINACNDPGAQKMVHINPMTGRKMTGCMLNGRIYVVVDDKDDHNITAYPKEEFRFWDELVRYFRFSGYTK